MTAHARITWALSLVTLLTLALSYAAIWALLDRYQERQLDTALLEVAHAEAREAPANRFSFTGRPGPAANDVGPLDKYGVMFDERGVVLTATQPFDSDPGHAVNAAHHGHRLDAPFDFEFHGKRFRGVETGIPGYPKYRLLLASSRDDLDGDSRFVRQAMMIAFAVAAVVLLAAVGYLVQRNLREHGRIAETLHRIAQGETEARVPGDVSDVEFRRIGHDVDEIAKRLASLVERQRRFIAHAAHELRSPLTALHGEIQQALRKERSAEDYRASLGFLNRASGRLTHLANQLLELARAEDKAERRGPVSIDRSVQEVIESLTPLIKEKNVSVRYADSGHVVHAVANDVERILRNLVDNALRFSAPSETIAIAASHSGDSVSIAVQDRGPGVEPELREAIFEPFNRSSVARSEARGAGLGLSIARELARKHGGDVTVAEGVGGCFVLTLKAAESAPAR